MHIARQPARFAAGAFAILAGMAVVSSAHAQAFSAEAFTLEFLRAAPLQKHELFKHAVAWMVQSPGSARPFIQVQSEQLGTMVGRGTLDINIGGDLLLNMPVTYELRIDVRDNRYKMTFSDVKLPSDGIPRSIEYSDRGTDERQAQEYFEQLAASLEKHLAAASEYRPLVREPCRPSLFSPSLLLEDCGAQ